jgi:nucleosome binding factor SPN SPT16 subunit
LAAVSDIAWVHFERVSRNRGTSTFDMVVIFKEYKEKPVKIGSIQVSMLDTIKRWVVGSGLPHSVSFPLLHPHLQLTFAWF